jgi:DNA-binding PadR family transcriptional regulator
MDIIILKNLRNNHLTSGYEVIKYLHKRYKILLSSGTVYSMLYALERQHLIEGNANNGKRMYKITTEGEEFLKEILVKKGLFYTLLSSVFSEA